MKRENFEGALKRCNKQKANGFYEVDKSFNCLTELNKKELNSDEKKRKELLTKMGKLNTKKSGNTKTNSNIKNETDDSLIDVHLLNLSSPEKKTKLKAFYILCHRASGVHKSSNEKNTNNVDLLQVLVDFFIKHSNDVKIQSFCLRSMRNMFRERIEKFYDDSEDMVQLRVACEEEEENVAQRNEHCITYYGDYPGDGKFIPLKDREDNYKIIETNRRMFINTKESREILIKSLGSVELQYNALIILWLISYSKTDHFEEVLEFLMIFLKNKEQKKMVRVSVFILSNMIKNEFFFSLVSCNDILVLLNNFMAIDKESIKNSDEKRRDGGKIRPGNYNKGPERSLGSKDSFLDHECKSHVDYVIRVLKSKLVKTSSLQNYLKELFSGNLENTPYHFSDLFWSINSDQLKHFAVQIIRAIKLYFKSGSALSKSVAANDLFRFVKVCPEVVKLVNMFDLKKELVGMCESSNDEVRFYALKSLSVCIFEEWH